MMGFGLLQGIGPFPCHQLASDIVLMDIFDGLLHLDHFVEVGCCVLITNRQQWFENCCFFLLWPAGSCVRHGFYCPSRHVIAHRTCRDIMEENWIAWGSCSASIIANLNIIKAIGIRWRTWRLVSWIGSAHAWLVDGASCCWWRDSTLRWVVCGGRNWRKAWHWQQRRILCRNHGQVEYPMFLDVDVQWWQFLNFQRKITSKVTTRILIHTKSRVLNSKSLSKMHENQMSMI